MAYSVRHNSQQGDMLAKTPSNASVLFASHWGHPSTVLSGVHQSSSWYRTGKGGVGGERGTVLTLALVQGRYMTHSIGIKFLICWMQRTIRAIEGAYQQIDHAIAQALYEHKPVLIQVASNMASLTHPLFEKQPVPFSLSGKMTNEVSSTAA